MSGLRGGVPKESSMGAELFSSPFFLLSTQDSFFYPSAPKRTHTADDVAKRSDSPARKGAHRRHNEPQREES